MHGPINNKLLNDTFKWVILILSLIHFEIAHFLVTVTVYGLHTIRVIAQ